MDLVVVAVGSAVCFALIIYLLTTHFHNRKVVSSSNSIEYDEKRIETLLNNDVASAVNGIIQLAATKGVNAKALPRAPKKSAG